MILADTSIWIDHMHAEDLDLRRQLENGQIAMHPFVAGELALGPLPHRKKMLLYFDLLPQLRVAQTSEVRRMIEDRGLYNRGIGLTDAHLIAAVFINPSTQLWTRDKALRKIAQSLGIHAALK